MNITRVFIALFFIISLKKTEVSGYADNEESTNTTSFRPEIEKTTILQNNEPIIEALDSENQFNPELENLESLPESRALVKRCKIEPRSRRLSTTKNMADVETMSASKHDRRKKKIHLRKLISVKNPSEEKVESKFVKNFSTEDQQISRIPKNVKEDQDSGENDGTDVIRNPQKKPNKNKNKNKNKKNSNKKYRCYCIQENCIKNLKKKNNKGSNLLQMHSKLIDCSKKHGSCPSRAIFFDKSGKPQKQSNKKQKNQNQNNKKQCASVIVPCDFLDNPTKINIPLQLKPNKIQKPDKHPSIKPQPTTPSSNTKRPLIPQNPQFSLQSTPAITADDKTPMTMYLHPHYLLVPNNQQSSMVNCPCNQCINSNGNRRYADLNKCIKTYGKKYCLSLMTSDLGENDDDDDDDENDDDDNESTENQKEQLTVNSESSEIDDYDGKSPLYHQNERTNYEDLSEYDDDEDYEFGNIETGEYEDLDYQNEDHQTEEDNVENKICYEELQKSSEDYSYEDDSGENSKEEIYNNLSPSELISENNEEIFRNPCLSSKKIDTQHLNDLKILTGLNYEDVTLLRSAIYKSINDLALRAKDRIRSINERINPCEIVEAPAPQLNSKLKDLPLVEILFNIPTIRNTIVNTVKDILPQITGVTEDSSLGKLGENVILNSLRTVIGGEENFSEESDEPQLSLANKNPSESIPEFISRNLKKIIERIGFENAEDPRIQNIIVNSVGNIIKRGKNIVHNSVIWDALKDNLYGTDDESEEELFDEANIISRHAPPGVIRPRAISNYETLKKKPRKIKVSSKINMKPLPRISVIKHSVKNEKRDDNLSTHLTDPHAEEIALALNEKFNNRKNIDNSLDKYVEKTEIKYYSPRDRVLNYIKNHGAQRADENVNEGEKIKENDDPIDGIKLPLTIKKMTDGTYALTLPKKISNNMLSKKCPCCGPKFEKIHKKSKDTKDEKNQKEKIQWNRSTIINEDDATENPKSGNILIGKKKQRAKSLLPGVDKKSRKPHKLRKIARKKKIEKSESNENEVRNNFEQYHSEKEKDAYVRELLEIHDVPEEIDTDLENQINEPDDFNGDNQLGKRKYKYQQNSRISPLHQLNSILTSALHWMKDEKNKKPA